jgi:hypothetical protein
MVYVCLRVSVQYKHVSIRLNFIATNVMVYRCLTSMQDGRVSKLGDQRKSACVKSYSMIHWAGSWDSGNDDSFEACGGM